MSAGPERRRRPPTLPATVPIFPLSGVVLLPRARLPLNVFEPRYLAMTRDMLVGHRMIGMVQPLADESEGPPPVYEIGCAGRIAACKETDDGRRLVTLTGVCRFRVLDELPLAEGGYRQVRVDYSPFADDLLESTAARVDRERLLAALKACFPPGGEAQIDWQAVDDMAPDALVTNLAMVFPLAASEKQALLECRDTEERARVLTALMEMAALGGSDEGRIMQ